jgi:hypothetical protein
VSGGAWFIAKDVPALHRGFEAGKYSEVLEKFGVMQQSVLVLMLALHGR